MTLLPSPAHGIGEGNYKKSAFSGVPGPEKALFPVPGA